jgi:hypothetical protein
MKTRKEIEKFLIEQGCSDNEIFEIRSYEDSGSIYMEHSLFSNEFLTNLKFFIGFEKISIDSQKSGIVFHWE